MFVIYAIVNAGNIPHAMLCEIYTDYAFDLSVQ